MHIDWATLGQVAVVSVLLTVAMVGVFSLGVRTTAGPRTSATPAGWLCFAVCAAAVGYGIWLIAV
jgi:hypothetical protein